MITIVKPGLLTTIQDNGRWGFQANGMPVAGAMDRYAYRAANILAGNSADTAVFEMTMLGATFQFAQDAWVAVCGADMQGTLNGEKITNWSSFFVPAGSELAFNFAVQGCRTYLAVKGGLDVPQVLGSQSTYTRGRIGGHEGRALRAGDVIAPLHPATGVWNTVRKLPTQWIPQYSSDIAIRVLLGPQENYFTANGIATFLGNRYTITDEADRMGYRLEGAKIEHSGKPDIISDALCQGAIQVPGHGMPIIMMADRQTTGGYAKIGTVIGPDLSLLAQAAPGNTVRFIGCTDEEAVAALRDEQDKYRQMDAWLAAEPQAGNVKRCYTVKVNGIAYAVQVEEVK